MLTEHIFDSDALLLQALNQRVQGTIQDAIEARQEASIAVSGGNTPRPLFQQLAIAAIDYSKVFLTLVDERWVDVEDDASNEKMLRATLLQQRGAAAHFIGLKNAASTAFAGVAATSAALATLPQPFDLVMLGMGDDGHTASLFPGASQLAEGLSTTAACLAVTPPLAPHERITLSAHRLLQSRQLIVQISGAAKLEAYRQVLQAGPIEDHPIRFFLRQQVVPIDVYASR